ncbi:MAG: protein kinase, partial [Myxococcales bacterium]
DGRAVITDFGIARGVFDAGLRHTLNAVLGTPAYMAPEQVEGSRDLTPAADIYALGVMLYEMFTGILPWTGSSVFAVAAARLHREPPDVRSVRPDLPEDLAGVIRRCMARQPGDRYGQVAELGRALDELCVADVRPAPGLRATSASPVLAAASPLASKTVAVLPFRSVGSPDDAYLADGLTEDLIDQLSMTSGLRVRPRGAVKHLADAPGDARELGQQLGVQVVVEGSLRRAGDRLRVTTRLISVADGFQLWARRSDRTPAEVLALSDELAQAIAEALTVAPQPPARVAPTDPRALDAYFRGRFEYHKFNPEALARAVAYLEEARSLAPDDPMILSGYALACTRHWFFGSPGRAEQARVAAERACALAPHRAEPLVGLASYSFFLDDVPRAVRLLRQALALNADIPDAHDMLGKILVESGPVRRGIDHLERAAQLDPAFRANRSNIGRALALDGRPGEAQALLDAMVRDEDSDPARVLQLRMMVWRGDREGARAMSHLPLLERTPFAQAMVNLLLDPDSSLDPADILAPKFNSAHATWRGRSLFHQVRCEFALVRGQHERALEALADAVSVGLEGALVLAAHQGELAADLVKQGAAAPGGVGR